MIDSHAHYDNEKFSLDRDDVIQKAFASGVTHIVNPGCDVKSSKEAVHLAESFQGFFAAVGFHPHDASSYTEEDMSILESLCLHAKVVAIGEVGLDYHYDFSPRDVQKHVLEEHIRLAKRTGLPLILHDRESHRDLMDTVIREQAMDVGGVFHCWSGSREMAEEAVRLGFYIGIGGSVTFKNAKKTVEVATHIPLNRILIETDCPYLAPEPHRGSRNWSGLMVHVLEKLAFLRNTSVEEMEQITTENAIRLFKLPKIDALN